MGSQAKSRSQEAGSSSTRGGGRPKMTKPSVSSRVPSNLESQGQLDESNNEETGSESGAVVATTYHRY